MLSKALAWFNHKDRRERSLTSCSLFQKGGSPFTNEPDVLILPCPTDLQNDFRSQSTKTPLLGGCLDEGREDGNQAESLNTVCLPGAANISFK